MPDKKKTDLIPIMKLDLMELSQFLSDIKIKPAANLNIAFMFSHLHFQK